LVGPVESAKANTSTGQKSKIQRIWDKTRIRHFSEFMTPPIEFKGQSVLGPDGAPVDPMNIFSIFWMDYEFAKDFRVLYFQRVPFNLVETPAGPGPDATISDPRFALRITNFLPEVVRSQVDIYAQPGWSRGSAHIGRLVEPGFQLNFSWTPKHGKFTVGFLGDWRFSVFKRTELGQRNMYGFAAPWFSYNITSKLSTQSWFNFPYRHDDGKPWLDLRWGYPGEAYMQNGLGYQISEMFWGALLINNYMLSTPRARNTWFSLWLSTALK
jgi:hypothetical protein